MNFLFRVDSGQEIGTGHVMRCLTLATKLHSENHHVLFIVKDHKANVSSLIVRAGFKCISIPLLSDQNEVGFLPWLGSSQKQDAELTIKEIVALDYEIDWLIVDHYSISMEWEGELRRYCRKLMIIDDLADRYHLCDLLVDQTLGRDEGSYKALLPEHCELAVGVQFAMLRSEFMFDQEEIKKRRQLCSKKEKKRLLVMMGGSDHLNLSLKILREIKSHPVVESITVLLGMSAPHIGEVRSFCKHEKGINLVIGSSDVSSVLLDHDICIGAPGGGAWERCAAGIPTIQIEFADNQKLVARSLQLTGAVIAIGDECDPEALFDAIYRVSDMGTYWSMSSAAQGLCDGHGADRVKELIYRLS